MSAMVLGTNAINGTMQTILQVDLNDGDGDGATSNTANFVQDWCKDNMAGFCKKIYGPLITKFKSNEFCYLEYFGKQFMFILSPKCNIAES